MEKRARELKSIAEVVLAETMNALWILFSCILSLTSHPLFSCFVTLCIVILLYFPWNFFRVAFSPVLILTGMLLLALLRLGATQSIDSESKSNSSSNSISAESDSGELGLGCKDRKRVECRSEKDPRVDSNSDQSPFFADSFLEWDVRAPLEVIYEEYEGEEADDASNEKDEATRVGIERFPSLSMYYPETDTDSSSEGEFPGTRRWDSLENVRYRWEDEGGEELIEIIFEGKGASNFLEEEDNLIEIDISPVRNK
ncbi:uncharacterized protein LOC131156672 [Malania oleifera]|uniref:uncharacterized protein LOC131156672 n=1 Tax=Malania oleifera TaxID=397392 RepID=UPI0025ADE20C|nr:uncharacterized protein LOC131156672 [Malania oleifera]